MEKVLELRNKALKVLSDKLSGFYLGGGTALTLYYFNHRESYDLDFFTKEFDEKKIEDLISHVSEKLGIKATLAGRQNSKKKAKILIYQFPVDSEKSFKIDFIEDQFVLLNSPLSIEGIQVLSKDDIYLRKIYAICGSCQLENPAGRKVFVGGRQEAKDFFDLYYLSKTYVPLSKFAEKFCKVIEKESLILWYRTYDRNTIKMDLLDIITDKPIDYREMDRHFKKEIELIIKTEVGEL